MTKKICVISGSRAEFGLLKSTMKKIADSADLDLQIILTGTHLEKKYGLTIDEIKLDGFFINKIIKSVNSSDERTDILKSISTCVEKIGLALNELKPDILLLLGDRFEIFAAAIAGHVLLIPVAHIHGGEITEGALDDGFRHSITKLSKLHFVSTNTYAKRVIQMGEVPQNVVVTGGLGVDSISNLKLLSKREIENEFKFSFGRKNLLVTLHPETVSEGMTESHIRELLKALEMHQEIYFIFTMPNADTEGNIIYQHILNFLKKNKNSILIKSFGHRAFLSCLKYVDGVIGNSSSGLLEAPSFKIGTINIGERQRGRLQALSIINCEIKCESIHEAIERIFSEDFKKCLKNVENPYGNGGASEIIVQTLSRVDHRILKNKKFYDIDFEVEF